jgi:hypothetical protein
MAEENQYVKTGGGSYNKCEHGRQKHQCKDCGGSGICEHGKNKYTCKECGGSGICEHGRQKHLCKECGGSAICEHGRNKSQCKECGGSSICEHNRRKTQCKECGGSQVCEHNRQKPTCKECKGVSICEHGRQKSQCKDCGGSSICEHGKPKPHCKTCGGSQICEHGRQKPQCKDCGGSQICEHGKPKPKCKTCGGSALCKSDHCETTGNKKYNGYCLPCCIQVCPDIQVSRNYKTKERDVVDRITQTFTSFTWVADKKVQDGCSLRRPDLLLDMGSHIIIVEIDENKHTDYDCSCENKRLMQISQDLQHRPIVFIRFNPDSYTNQAGVLIKSCWRLNKLGVMQIIKTKQTEWEERIAALKQQIQYWIDNPTDKTIEIVQLFY